MCVPPPITLSDEVDSACHDHIVKLVDTMLKTKKQLQRPQLNDRNRNHYEGNSASLDCQIDALVYEFYELTDEEIILVEAG